MRGADVIGYTYDDRNRPVAVSRYGGAWATYAYNGLEQLVIRATTVPVGPIGGSHYVYDLDGHLIAEADALTGATIREYLWLDDRPVAIVDNVSTTPVLYFVHADHLARPVLATDGAKAPVWSAVWKPFGEAQAITGPLSLDARFPGQWFQIETGLAYNWHRHYDAATGRYTQTDSLGFVDGPSLYNYARSSPQMFVDKDGLLSNIGHAQSHSINQSIKGQNSGGGVCAMTVAMSCDDAYMMCMQLRGIRGARACSQARAICQAGLSTIFAPGIVGE